MRIIRPLLIVAVILTLAGVARAAPQPEYWSYWNKSSQSNSRMIDHRAWDRLLARYVIAGEGSGINRFHYGRVTDVDRQALAGYIGNLASLDPREYRKREQLAYWMNLYNALSVQAILSQYPITGPLPTDFWRKPRVEVADQSLSLDDIEHRILRPLWDDHRIHFGLNCASLDCPNMPASAYRATTVDDQLKTAGRAFVNDDRGVAFVDGELRVSRLFRDYRQDFADSDKKLVKLFAYYAEDMKALYLLGYQGEIRYRGDDRLNAP